MSWYAYAPEICICAAIKMYDGYIVRGHRHSDCFSAAAGYERYKNLTPEQRCEHVRGFMTTKNRFVGRHDGYDLMRVSGIARRVYDPAGSGNTFDGEWAKDGRHPLFSEDLY